MKNNEGKGKWESPCKDTKIINRKINNLLRKQFNGMEADVTSE